MKKADGGTLPRSGAVICSDRYISKTDYTSLQRDTDRVLDANTRSCISHSSRQISAPISVSGIN